ncbi:MAG: hypothetical protein AB1349_01570 [Elusimicrobiota bacterium]
MKFPFEYTTISRLRNEGISVQELDDQRARDIIELMSLYINSLTDQWFTPVEDTVSLDGNNTSSIFLRNLIPIIKVKRLCVSDEVIEPEKYQIDWRRIRLLEGHFPEGRLNIEIEGVFGWLENQKEQSALLQSEIITGSVEAILDSVEGFNVRDIVDFIDTKNHGIRIIINEIDVQSRKLKFDSVRVTLKIEPGAKVISYGTVPKLIERACMLLVINNKEKINSAEWSEKKFSGLLKRETVDNYSWEIFQEAAGMITSDPLTDEILGNYCPPPTVEFI